jgi:alpha-L-fucosidase
MKRILSSILLTLFAYAIPIISQTYKPTWESLDKRPVPTWFENAKFGIFIHWGVYSVPSWASTKGSVYEKYAEWYWNRVNSDTPLQSFVDFHKKTYGEKVHYQDFVNQFKAELFNPDQWAEIIKNSGAKYVVLTSKHCEGFALWPSSESLNWNSVDVGPHRDLCGDLTNAVKKQGLKMGFYYSLYEWFNPVYKSNPAKYVDEHMIPQMKDLVTRYKPDILWADAEWEHTSSEWKSPEFLAWLFNDSPVKDNIAINDRWGKDTRGKHGGYYTTEYNLVDNENVKEKVIDHPWEECRGIGSSFGYNRNENLEDYNSSEALIHVLIEKVARGGNLLLDIGPTADGRIPVIMQQRLADIGSWLKINGESIYNSRVWNHASNNKIANVYFTSKPNAVYVFVTKWTNKPLTLKVDKHISGVQMLGYSGKIKYSASNKSVTIVPPILTPDKNPCQAAWVYKLILN